MNTHRGQIVITDVTCALFLVSITAIAPAAHAGSERVFDAPGGANRASREGRLPAAGTPPEQGFPTR